MPPGSNKKFPSRCHKRPMRSGQSQDNTLKCTEWMVGDGWMDDDWRDDLVVVHCSGIPQPKCKKKKKKKKEKREKHINEFE